MQYPYESANSQTLWYRQIAKHFFQTSAFFIHACFFVAVTLIGIARHGHAVPAVFTILMTLWSVGFLLHGIMTYRTEADKNSNDPKSQDGVMRTVLLSSGISAVMWVMWTLATDARDSTPWHLSIWITLVVVAISTMIIGKRALYNHWQKKYLENNSIPFEETKPKRHDISERLLHLSEDGELPDDFDEQSEKYINLR